MGSFESMGPEGSIADAMKWEVKGADADTGNEVVILVEALDPDQAERRARRRGVLCSDIRCVPEKASLSTPVALPSADPPSAPIHGLHRLQLLKPQRREKVIVALAVATVIGATTIALLAKRGPDSAAAPRQNLNGNHPEPVTGNPVLGTPPRSVTPLTDPMDATTDFLNKQIAIIGFPKTVFKSHVAGAMRDGESRVALEACFNKFNKADIRAVAFKFALAVGRAQNTGHAIDLPMVLFETPNGPCSIRLPKYECALMAKEFDSPRGQNADDENSPLATYVASVDGRINWAQVDLAESAGPQPESITGIPRSEIEKSANNGASQ
jgi:hypothetical protein